MRRFLRVASILLAVSVAALFAVAASVYHDLTTAYRAFPGDEVFVEVPPGAGAGRIAELLEDNGVIPSSFLLRAYLRWSGQGGDLQAGEYRFSRSSSPLEVLARLQRGDVFLHQITVPEGLDLREVGEVLVASGFWEQVEIETALADVSRISDMAPGAPSLEGFLFPETYRFPRSATAGDLVGSMLDRFRAVFDPEMREESAARGLTVLQAVTLASLIEEEVRVPGEAATVASVLHNRLDRGMRLEVDATVIYALRQAGRYKPPLRRSDLDFDSPWNTYRIATLPPGPIASPGRVALEAAVRPADTDYLYYVLKPDGSGLHQFSKSFREHQRAVQALHSSR